MKRDGLKTYSHLAAARRMPSTYEVATSELLYYRRRGGFEVDVPVRRWYELHQDGSPLRCGDWERFRDPRETTYTSYVALHRDQEEFVDRLVARAAANGADAVWRDLLGAVLPPLRYAFHALQMTAAYVGQLAPGGRIVVVCAFQAADHVRRVHRIAQQIAMFRRDYPTFADDARERWERGEAWQPLRRALERLLVTWDWGEALVAANASLGCAMDALLLEGVASLARTRGEFALAELLGSLVEDGRWHREWTRALLRLAASDPVHGPGSRAAIAAWLERWRPLAEEAIAGAAPLLGDAADDVARSARAALDACAADVLDDETVDGGIA